MNNNNIEDFVVKIKNGMSLLKKETNRKFHWNQIIKKAKTKEIDSTGWLEIWNNAERCSKFK